MRDNLRLLDLDFDDDFAAHACAVTNAGCSADPFTKPDYRGKRHARPVGRVVHKSKPRRARVQWVEVMG